MAQRARRTGKPAPDLNATLEALAARIGHRIGRSIAAALGSQATPPAPVSGPSPGAKRCEKPGCDRPAAAKGLCKSHYNLALYHRRKERARTAVRGPKAKGPRGKAKPVAKASVRGKAGKAPARPRR